MSAPPHSPNPGGAGGPDAHDHGHCGNCEAVLTGPYCAQCGQHAHASARNLAAVVHDAWHDLTHVDGRLWHTLWLLLVRPGRLTEDYFLERRARYLPPFRLYLVLSLVFFSLGLNVNQIKVNAPDKATAGATGTPAKAPPGAQAPSSAATNTPPEKPSAAARQQPAGDESAAKSDDSDGDGEGLKFECETVRSSLSPWLEKQIRDACVRHRADNGATFLRTLLHNIPKMMFVFLPLMAAVMLLLYWRPRRYYVEHLVFLLHNHSALYLWFTLLRVLGLVEGLWRPLGGLTAFAGIATAIYVIWYPYRAMRRYYGQGRWLTILKYTLIAWAYLFCLILTLTGAGIVTALED